MIPKRKRQRYKEGDVFVVPLSDGTYSLGQVLSIEPEALNSVACGFYDIRIVDGPDLEIPAPLPQKKLFAALLVTPESLKRATWPVVGDRAVGTTVANRPYEQFRSKKWIGAKIIGSGIVRRFLEAFFGLAPWDAMADPSEFDKLLVHPSLKPKEIVRVRSA